MPYLMDVDSHLVYKTMVVTFWPMVEMRLCPEQFSKLKQPNPNHVPIKAKQNVKKKLRTPTHNYLIMSISYFKSLYVEQFTNWRAVYS